MTRSLRDRSADSPRAAFLDALAIGMPVKQALAAAYDGRIPVKHWVELESMRKVGGAEYDEEIAHACAAAAQKERENDGKEQGTEAVCGGAGVLAVQGEKGLSRDRMVVDIGSGEDDRRVLQDGSRRAQASGETEGSGEAWPLALVRGGHVSVGSDQQSEWADGRVSRGVGAGIDQSNELTSRCATDVRINIPFDHLMRVNDACVAHGMPSLSEWWTWSLGEFYASGKPWGFFRVGRGGGKSSSLERVAASDSYYVERHIPPGQVWTWPFISIGPDDANRRVDGIEAVYRAVGLPFVGDDTGETDEKNKPIKVKDGEGVSIVHSPRAALSLKDAGGNTIKLMSIAGTIGNISGPSTIGLIVDEAEKLHDKSEHVNPLTEIIASGAQTSRGRAGWRGIVCSSAWEEGGTHDSIVKRGDTETNFVAKIGAQFLDAALRGFEDVAQWEEKRGDHDAAKRIRTHASSLTGDSPMVPTWVANPTIGNPKGEPWEGAALATRMLAEVLPEQSLNGIPRILYWLRENGSLPLAHSSAKPGPLDGVEIQVTTRAYAVRDRIVGIAPGGGRVEVIMGDDSFLVTFDESNMTSDALGGVTSTSVIACATDQARAVEAERLAWLSGRNGAILPPVAPQPIYDGSVLRLAPLRTLYERGRLRHAPGLATLEAELRAHRDDSGRNPRLEALLAAVMRLVACYPWLAGGAQDEVPWRGPRVMGSVLDMDDREAEMVRKMGGR